MSVNDYMIRFSDEKVLLRVPPAVIDNEGNVHLSGTSLRDAFQRNGLTADDVLRIERLMIDHRERAA